MLVTLKELMITAEEKNIAVGAFDVPGIANVMAAVEAAETLNVPVILMHAQVHENICGLDYIGPAMVAAAKKASVPVCVHLDHGEDIEYIEKAINMGFTSVMIDASNQSFSENVKKTCEVVALAKRFGVSVEAELGSLGKRESGAGEETSEDETVSFTDADEAVKFVELTGIDALACSFGTAHGLYRHKPTLHFDVLQRIREKLRIPLVMHGSSGIAKDEFTKAISCGIRKINYYAYMAKAGGDAISHEVIRREQLHQEGAPLLYHDMLILARQGMQQHASEALRTFNKL